MSNEIKVGRIYRKEIDNRVRICSELAFSSKVIQKKTLWYELDMQYKGFLSEDRADAFLIALLPYAMINQYDMSFETPISQALLYRIRNLVMPTLCEANKKFHNIRIEASAIENMIVDNRGVAVALSGGVDSFYTLLKNLKSKDNSVRRITHLTLFNVGAFGINGGSEARRSFQEKSQTIARIAKQLDLPLITVDSNISEILKLDFEVSISFRDISTAVLLERKIDTYYISGGYRLSETKVDENDIRKYENWIIHSISNQNMNLIWFGGEASRIEKLEYISQYDIVRDNLYVCTKDMLNISKNRKSDYHDINCSIYCEKCLKTMLELFSIGRLEDYEITFNVELFMRNIDKYMGYTLYQKDRKISWYVDIYKRLLEKNYIFSSVAYQHAKNYKKEHRKWNEFFRRKFYWFYPF